MASIVVCGGSVIGLTAAMLLGRDGHDVVVLERDPAPPPPDPAAAWDAWDRPGVAQHHQPHNLFPRVKLVLEAELPGVYDELAGAGCTWWRPLASMPPGITDRDARPGDERFSFVTGRRPTVEAVVAHAAVSTSGVRVERGVGVEGLLGGDDDGPGTAARVVGVRTTRGDELVADLVVDAMGRRSPFVEWIGALGAPAPHVESEDRGFVYYTRYFRGPDAPAMLGPPLVPFGSFSLLTLPGDNDTWSVTVWGAAADALLRGVRDPERFCALVEACPLHAHWLLGEPLTDVLAMASILDKHRRFVVDGDPVVVGAVPVGDAWACTNPSAGRGISVGMIHAQCLRDAVRDGVDDPVAFARRFDQLTDERAAPFVREQFTADRARIAEMDAERDGRPVPAPDADEAAMASALVHDADVFRAYLEIRLCLATVEEVLARPGFGDRLAPYRHEAPPQMPGPSRADLEQLLG
jgi:2-polyprenyl-6-methoxyphenol hydroxylase-like FAD-dependent oxidoreductase